MDDRTTTLLLQALGVLFFAMGVMGMLGVYKRWYWSSPTRAYGYAPFGLLFILVSLEKQLRELLGANFWMLIAAYVLILGLGLWGFIKPLDAFKPAWIKRIEAEPKRVYEAMASEAKGSQDWKAKVATPEALEDWIKEIQKKQRFQKKSK